MFSLFSIFLWFLRTSYYDFDECKSVTRNKCPVKVYYQNFVIQERMKAYEFMQNAALRIGSGTLHINL